MTSHEDLTSTEQPLSESASDQQEAETGNTKVSSAADANDYSRFDKVGADSDSISEDSDSDDDPEGDDQWPAEERLARAESCKSSGNDFFKSKDNAQAIKFYEKGLKVLKPLRDLEASVLDEEVCVQMTMLTCSLLLNSALVQSRSEKHKESKKLASEAIEALDGKHAKKLAADELQKQRVKALFRRGVAYARLGDLEEAKSDLVALLKVDRSNREAIREYNAVKQKLEKARASQQQQFAAAFKKASETGGVYGDKEAERKRAALRKIEEERKRREEWKKSTEASGSELSFEDWCKEEDKRAEEERKAQEAADKERREREAEERRQRAAEERRRREAARKENGDDSDIELDEEDRKILEETRKKGYCYFRTERSAEDERLLKQNQGPAKLSTAEASEANAAGNGNAFGDASEAVKRSASSTSAWNAGGTTWEERDVSKAAQEGLESILAKVRVTSEVSGQVYEASISKVESVDGDAQIVVARAKPAPVYDMEAKLKWQAKCVGSGGDSKTEARGKMHLPDIANGVEAHNLEVSVSTSRGFPEAHQANLNALLEKLEGEVCRKTWQFVSNLHEHL
mmetsp:Transcript_7731/g.15367  ORF Transcript_7731/g.15367 Transcript_7731/m.15367 type:complete len:574 (+) Transcript_7731:315-2036(+)|eukprot:CAMPEP_0171496648 /NCGR_PEP_ID=MMETSP0958-20121227/6824_1 /TAXON_ID=87120 /ORGANISM="Aurantiochytrium limacinum, Strain ATCCMYA-1381" /LENGTH=573 /DNA_ID=CAMNT_0012030785 /DNA_START=228 /DNA_END=1949 /DNA_ORIENTATION=-